MKRRVVMIILASVLLGDAAVYGVGEFVTIPATKYQMLEGPTKVKVTVYVSEFLISKTEVTQEEFMEVTGFNPSHYKGDKRPVENVSWWDAIKYCNLRSIKEKLEPCYDLSTGECNFSKNGYRLPTDTEWNIAAGHATTPNPNTVHKKANIGSTNTKDAEELLKAMRHKGTKQVGSYPPNKFGLYDMLGNVWEWCYDYHSSIKDNLTPLQNPRGPSWGLERTIRGGSFISTIIVWNMGYRSSIRPDHKSRFTGFRVCRSSEKTESKPVCSHDEGWFTRYNNVPKEFENKTGELSQLLVDEDGNKISTLAQWQQQRPRLKTKWAKMLGAPSIAPPGPEVTLVRSFKEEDYTGKLMYLKVEPDHWEKILLMLPNKPITTPTPVVIVPYYDVDTPAGKNLGGHNYYPKKDLRSFGYHMVREGYIAVAIRWYDEGYGEKYAESVVNLKLKYPNCTGLGKWVWDSQRLVDYLYSLPEVDKQNIGIIGHSLGAKMALYAAAMDERITTAVGSEPGIGLSFSNYDDYWYFGGFIKNRDKSTDQHELLVLIAPRAFLLIGGDAGDTNESWYYINAARGVYDLFGKAQNIGYFNHRSGHTPTPEAMYLSVEWLKHFLGD